MDITIVCGKSEKADDKQDALFNWKVIIEVLSLSAEGYDPGKKLQYYREIESLREYSLVSRTIHVLG
ncbi:MAG: Uma2 family endonuclease [Anaerolineaceae bacterium]|nr:Uma2 family endonuclease [Anaerolineaceae bacterium]